MIVIDANIIAYYYITSNRSEEASEVMAKDSDWIVPSLWKSEFRNALLQYVRHSILTVEKANLLCAAAENFLDNKAFDVATSLVLEVANSSLCSAYECEYVALAKDLRVPLVTEDKRVLREFPNIAVSMTQFTNSA